MNLIGPIKRYSPGGNISMTFEPGLVVQEFPIVISCDDGFHAVIFQFPDDGTVPMLRTVKLNLNRVVNWREEDYVDLLTSHYEGIVIEEDVEDIVGELAALGEEGYAADRTWPDMVPPALPEDLGPPPAGVGLIEDAPRDGTNIFLHGFDGGYRICSWDERRRYWKNWEYLLYGRPIYWQTIAAVEEQHRSKN